MTPEVLHSAQRVEPSARCGIAAREQDYQHPRTWDRASSETVGGEDLPVERRVHGQKPRGKGAEKDKGAPEAPPQVEGANRQIS